jgi:hypothetical protein
MTKLKHASFECLTSRETGREKREENEWSKKNVLEMGMGEDEEGTQLLGRLTSNLLG